MNGNYNYLKELYSKSDYKSDYLERVLEPLFFGVLNTKPEDREAIFKRNGWDLSLLAEWESITYLNGGLFEADENDKRQERFSEELFADLFEFFSHYNFTIDENDPNDAEVGIDPEMLGRIFENLLEDNKDKGTFYTHKEIVQYMCRQSLIEHLKTHTKDDLHDDITQIVNNHIVSKSLQSKENSRHIDTLLKEVKICDPAIGSGAFPMGLLNEIFAIRKLLFGFLGHNVDFNNAEIKKEIIQNNIYGVDIEQGAVDIARLRFWLSLVVDEEKPQPLPNLDYKIMQGNSLLESFMGVDLSKFSDSSVAQLDMLLTLFEADGTHKAIMELTKEYFTITDHQTKFELRHKINNKVKEHIKKCSNNKPEVVEAVEALKEGNYPFFLWHVYFNDVFERGGFDIVIGNPPYIQLQVNGGLLAGQLKGEKYETFARTGDIYCIFYERGLQILREGGIETYITSNKWMRAGYGEKLREYLTKNNPLQLLDLGAGVFESATVDTNILVVQKGLNNNEFRGATYSARDFNNIILAPINVSGGDIWTILSPLEQSIKSKIESVGTPLKDWDVEINYGIKTGYNEAFIINTAKRDELVAADPRSAEIIKPILRGRDIKRYTAQWAGLWLIATLPALKIDIDNYPAVKNYLESFGSRIHQSGKKGSRKKTNNKWFETQDQIGYYEQFEKEKIVYNDITQRLSFGLVETGMYFNNTAYFISSSAHNMFLLSLLNSRVYDWYYRQISAQLGAKAVRMFSIYVETLPVVKLSIEEQQPYIEIIDEILEAKQANSTTDTTALEAQIDQMVYALYNLTSDEIAIIEK